MSETAFKPHPFFARLWIKMSPKGEEHGAAGHRDDLLAGLRGRVLELGAGNGLNFAHYPPAVTEVLAVEPEPYLRERATAEAARAPVPITVVAGIADALPAEDGAVDAAVASLVLCTVPDQTAALAELHRVVRPGGALHFYEHVVGTGRLATAQSWLARSGVGPHLGGGCHSARDTAAAIAASGFAIERARRFDFPIGPVPVPHVIGVARRA